MKNNRSLIASTVLAFGILAGGVAPAHANLLTNGSFETPAATSGGDGSYCYLSGSTYNCGAFTGFAWSGSAPVIRANSGAWGNPSGLGGYSFGSQLVGIQNESSVSQALTLLAGDYDLSWSNAGRRGYAAASYQVLFNGALLGTFNTLGGDRWATEQVSFILSGTTAGALKFQGLNVAGDGTAFIDDVVLTANVSQVPEPQSLALVALALLGLGAARQRQRSR